jgi:NRAMP (natural resistance-associated macrophage protein)-like metal ion transporter
VTPPPGQDQPPGGSLADDDHRAGEAGRDPLLEAVARHAEIDDPALLKEPHLERRREEEVERTVEALERGDPRAYLRVLGPGLISGASDDDPSAIASFAQAGSQFGYGLLWSAPFTFPLMAAVQEMCARIALQTGVGLGVALRRRFPSWLVGACVVGLVVSNVITLGADLGAVAAGLELLSRGHLHAVWMVAPAAVLVLLLQFRATYETIFHIFKWLTISLFAYVLAGLLAHPQGLEVLRATVVPHLETSSQFLLTMAAVFGTAFSPYILFWQGSMEVTEMERAGTRDQEMREGVDRRHLRAARIDVLTGMLFAQLVMYFVILTTAATLHAHGITDITSPDQAARALEPIAGPAAFLLFALGFIGAGMLAVPVLSGSAAYAVTEFLGIPGTLEAKPHAAPTFYALIAAATAAGLAMNFLGINVIQALVIASAISGAVSAPLILLITVFGADRHVMRNRASGPLSRTLTWTAGVVMSAVALAWIFSPLLSRI